MSQTPRPASKAEVHPTEVLRYEHDVIGSMLGALESETERVAVGAPIDAHFWKGALEFFTTFADRCHHGKEEDLLFPALMAVGVSGDCGAVACMLEDHEQGRCMIQAMRGAVDDNDKRALTASAREYSRVLRRNVQRENDELFELARQVMSRETSAGMLEAFRSVQYNRYIELARELCGRAGVPFHGAG
jgi:hemerythrin-like domain-containing protein